MEESIDINYDEIKYSQDMRVDRLTTMEQVKKDFAEITEARELRKAEAETKKLEEQNAELDRLKEIEKNFLAQEETAPKD